jgi:hypothetical protein
MDEAITRASDALRPHGDSIRVRELEAGNAVIVDKLTPPLRHATIVLTGTDQRSDELDRVIAEAVADLTANPL